MQKIKKFSLIILLGGIFIISGLYLVVLLLPSLATPEDLKRLKELREFHGGRYEFKFERDQYVNAIVKPGAIIKRDELEQMFEKFFFARAGEQLLLPELPHRKNSGFQSFNIYDTDRKFLFQFYYDYKLKKFLTGNTEHY